MFTSGLFRNVGQRSSLMIFEKVDVFQAYMKGFLN